MEPDLPDGALVLVNTAHERLGADGIYVLMLDGGLVAKRLRAICPPARYRALRQPGLPRPTAHGRKGLGAQGHRTGALGAGKI